MKLPQNCGSCPAEQRRDLRSCSARGRPTTTCSYTANKCISYGTTAAWKAAGTRGFEVAMAVKREAMPANGHGIGVA